MQLIPEEEDFETVVDVPLSAYIPQDYIPDEFQKLDAYKKIAGIETQQDFEDMEEELTDRYGKIPESVYNLLLIALVKASAHRASITEIKKREGEIAMAILPEPHFDPVKLPDVLRKYQGRIQFKRYKSGNFFLCKTGDDLRKTMKMIRLFSDTLSAAAR